MAAPLPSPSATKRSTRSAPRRSVASHEARGTDGPDTSADLADLYLSVIPRAMSEIRVEIRDQHSCDLSMPQFRVLASLFPGRKSNKTLADLIGVNVTTMSRMIQGLEEQGLIEKSSVVQDRRVVSIELSKRGRKLFERIRSKTRDGLAVKIAELTSREQTQLKVGLEVLLGSFKSTD